VRVIAIVAELCRPFTQRESLPRAKHSRMLTQGSSALVKGLVSNPLPRGRSFYARGRRGRTAQRSKAAR
jgi:hypothetical protein